MANPNPNLMPEPPSSLEGAFFAAHRDETPPRGIKLPEDVWLEDLMALDDLDQITYPDGIKVETEAEEAAPELIREIRAELAFLNTEKELAEQVTRLEPALSGYIDRDVQEEVMRREKSFFTTVYATTLEMAERQPGPVTLLFDTDFTLTQTDPEVARPAAALVFRELENVLGDRLKVGIVSSRPKESLDDQLHHPTYTAGFSHLLDPDALISSGDLYRFDPAVREMVDGEDTAAQLAAVKDILDPKLRRQVLAGKVDIRDYLALDPKLIGLQNFITDHPNQAAILFDDYLQATGVKDDSSQVKGVRVDQQILAGCRLPYPETPRDIAPEEPELLAA